MKILIVECTAEELKANKTVMDCLTDALNNFTENFCGVRLTPGEMASVLSDADKFDESSDNPYQE